MLPITLPLPDEATPHAVAGRWSPIERVGGNHTLAGWLGMYGLLLLLPGLLFGGGLAVGRELGRTLFGVLP